MAIVSTVTDDTFGSEDYHDCDTDPGYETVSDPLTGVRRCYLR
jgi:hypothetical protein